MSSAALGELPFSALFVTSSVTLEQSAAVADLKQCVCRSTSLQVLMQTRMLKETFMTTQSARVSGDGARLKGMRGEKTYMAVKMLIIFFISDFFFEQGEFCVAS